VGKYEITLGGKTYTVEVGDVSASPVEVVVNGERKMVQFSEVREAAPVAQPVKPAAAPPPPPPPKPEPAPAPAPEVTPPGAVEGHAVVAPMPGKILSIGVQLGDQVSEGDTVCTLEAMKMEMPISATASGRVKAVHVQVGANVAYDDPLITLG